MTEAQSKFFDRDKQLKALIEVRAKRFDILVLVFFISIISLFTIGAPFIFLTEYALVPIIIACMIGFVIAWPLVQLIHRILEYIQHHCFKSYEIDIHENVIRLVGSVSFSKVHIAYKDLLSVRSGYKIVDGAYEQFGCTMAAVPATKAELDAKREVEKLGVTVRTIG